MAMPQVAMQIRTRLLPDESGCIRCSYDFCPKSTFGGGDYACAPLKETDKDISSSVIRNVIIGMCAKTSSCVFCVLDTLSLFLPLA